MTRLEAAFTSAAVILGPLGVAAIYHDLWWQGGLFIIAAVISAEGASKERTARRVRRPKSCCQFGGSSNGAAHSYDCTSRAVNGSQATPTPCPNCRHAMVAIGKTADEATLMCGYCTYSCVIPDDGKRS